jgi:predicted ATPase
MTAFLKNLAAAQPLVLVLDDLHAADAPSLLLLRFVARELGESRLLIVGAYRDVDPTLADPLTTTLTELAREPVTRTLALAGPGRGRRRPLHRARRARSVGSGLGPGGEG